MEMLARLTEDLKKAMLSGNQLEKDTIRSLKGAIKNAEIDKGSVLQNDEINQVIQKAAKQRRDSIDQYVQAARHDLADKEKTELSIIERYLPAQLSEEEIENIVKRAIADSGASAVSDMGKVMALIMPQVRGKADGSLVNQKVKAMLSEQ